MDMVCVLCEARTKFLYNLRWMSLFKGLVSLRYKLDDDDDDNEDNEEEGI
jgi:hypothetical protein